MVQLAEPAHWRLKLSEEAIKNEVPSANIRCLTLDLSSLAAVRLAAAEVNAYPEPLHILIHNAAAAIGPLKVTPDNLESQMATDHVGPFLLTKLLAPKLLAAGTVDFIPRVVYVSSILQSAVDIGALARPDPAKYRRFGAYAQAKAANVLMAVELSARAKGRLNAYSLKPGIIHTNILRKEESLAGFIALGLYTPDGKPNPIHLWKTIPQGAATYSAHLAEPPDLIYFLARRTVAAAFDTRLNEYPGAHLSDAMISTESLAYSSDPAIASKLWTATDEIIGEMLATESLAAHSSDPTIASKLWTATEEVIGEKFVL
ncbi:hypothetical protein B0H15DRAFT_800711 [Mycena belliarum]|uniref:Uncharacterized protein n=1 Tax=Mycena belliarum TaxID=1033014 RepID=A0AAD6XP37_9AGAR|nr:hypothetical protein B0H15DRAFT_800711 [Mycena belliae]